MCGPCYRKHKHDYYLKTRSVRLAYQKSRYQSKKREINRKQAQYMRDIWLPRNRQRANDAQFHRRWVDKIAKAVTPEEREILLARYAERSALRS